MTQARIKFRKLASFLLFMVGALWALPMSLIGFTAGLLTMMLGSRLRYSDHALVFSSFPFGPGGAITFGNVILNTAKDLDAVVTTYQCRADGNRNDCIRLGNHERAHVYQYMALGIFFLPIYFICGGISVKNPMERAADRYAMTGEGWWPWGNS
jgi:hypothetical protein